MITSNDLTGLDPALIRPGRCDLFFEYRKAPREQAKQFFTKFYADLSSARKHTAIVHVCGDKSHGGALGESNRELRIQHGFTAGDVAATQEGPHAAVQKVAEWVKVERGALGIKNESKETVKRLDDTVLVETKST